VGGDYRLSPEETDEMSGTDSEWKDWIIVLRVQAQDRYPPTQWAWGNGPMLRGCHWRATIGGTPGGALRRLSEGNRAGKADHVAKGVLTGKPTTPTAETKPVGSSIKWRWS